MQKAAAKSKRKARSRPLDAGLLAAALRRGAGAFRLALQTSAAAAALSLAIARADARPPSADRGANSDAAVAERVHPGFEPKGLPLGAFRAFPTFTVDATTIDNVFASETNEQSDFVTTLRPAVTIESNWSRHRLSFDGAVARTIHQDFADDDVTTTLLGADLTLDVRYNTQIGFGARFRDDAEGRSSPDSPVAALEPINYQARAVSGFASQTFNRVRLTVQAEREELDYEDARSTLGGIIEQDDRDRTETRGSLRLEYGLSPDTAILAEVRADDRAYDLAPATPALSRDSSGLSYLVGVNFDVTRLVRGEVAAGYFTQDYDAIGDTSGLAVDAKLEWFPTRLTTVSFTAARRGDDSGVPGAASILLTSAGVQVDHELRRNIVLSGGVNAAQREYRGGFDRDDDVWTGQVSARWQINRRVGVQVGAARESQDSTGIDRDRDFDINRAFAALTLRL
ncbi:MAG: outer membrane beta-barrel protein [Hyphomonadaceae bacterium]|nr:outer membrane beta-barrel protein [Hyphomonadaceae bacterium]